MINQYGVDMTYFRNELQELSERLDNKTPDELHRHLLVLASAAKPISDHLDKLTRCKECDRKIKGEDGDEDRKGNS